MAIKTNEKKNRRLPAKQNRTNKNKMAKLKNENRVQHETKWYNNNNNNSSAGNVRATTSFFFISARRE